MRKQDSYFSAFISTRRVRSHFYLTEIKKNRLQNALSTSFIPHKQRDYNSASIFDFNEMQRREISLTPSTWSRDQLRSCAKLLECRNECVSCARRIPAKFFARRVMSRRQSAMNLRDAYTAFEIFTRESHIIVECMARARRATSI